MRKPNIIKDDRSLVKPENWETCVTSDLTKSNRCLARIVRRHFIWKSDRGRPNSKELTKTVRRVVTTGC